MAQPTTTANQTNLPDCTCPLANYTGGQCWPGTYCPSGANYPMNCDPGKYCMQSGLTAPEGNCDAGYYCNASSTRPDPPGNVCPAGYYCEAGSGTPTPCPAGTMSNTVGNTNSSNCLQCTPGKREKERKKELSREGNKKRRMNRIEKGKERVKKKKKRIHMKYNSYNTVLKDC